MKQAIQIIVTEPDRFKVCKFKELFRNTIELDDSLSYDYQGMIKGLRLLFQNKHIIINLNIL